jgi:ferritin-like metal-binding protein YciE
MSAGEGRSKGLPGAAFEKHLEETDGRVERLEFVFEELGETARGNHQLYL